MLNLNKSTKLTSVSIEYLDNLLDSNSYIEQIAIGDCKLIADQESINSRLNTKAHDNVSFKFII